MGVSWQGRLILHTMFAAIKSPSRKHGMNILMMADFVLNPDSGAAGTEYQAVEAVRRLGHVVDTVWADSIPHRITNGNLHYLIELPVAFKAEMLSRMRNSHYDVIHVSQPHGFLAAKVLAEQGGRSVFIHRSQGLELRAERDLAKWLQEYGYKDLRPWGRIQVSRMISALLARHGRAIAKYASGHIVSASDCSRFLSEELDVPSERIAVIPQAAPPLYIEKPAPAMTPERLSRLLFVGQHAFFKAPMIVAAVLNQVIESDDNLSATWVTSKAAHGEVHNLLNENVRARVTLLDWMPQQELIDIYDSHGIFLFPSFFEGCGKVFVEAMARGLCVIAADNSAAKDVISHGRSGLLVPTGDIAAMIGMCIDLLESAKQAQALSQQAATRAREYTWDRVARETVAFYQSRLEANGPSLTPA